VADPTSDGFGRCDGSGSKFFDPGQAGAYFYCSGRVNMDPGQSWVRLFFTLGQKYEKVGSGQGPSLDPTQP